MPQQPILSIILPVYNSEEYIEETISSILHQSFRDFELIIIDDFSSDKSPEVIKSFKDPRIIYVRNEVNLQLIKTLNRGIELCHGKYIARIDSDDVCLPNRFEYQIKYLDKHPEVGMVGCLPIIINENGLVKHKSRHFIATEYSACKFACFFENQFVHPSIMVRSELLRDFKYSEAPCSLHMEDRELWCRMFLAGVKMSNLPNYLLKYRVHSGSICDTNRGEQTTNAQVIAHNYFKQYFRESIDVGLYFEAFNESIPFAKAIKKRSLMLRMYRVFVRTEKCSISQRLQIAEWMGKYLMEEIRTLPFSQKLLFLLTSNWKLWVGFFKVFVFMSRTFI